MGATKVYGLYQPNFMTVPWHIGPLLNPNNLAGYLNLGALAGLGVLLSHRPVIPRWALGLGVALIVAIDVTSASRGGVLALPVGLVALALFARHEKRDRPASQSASTWLLLFAVAGGGVLAVLGGNAKAWTELYDKNLSKLEMILWVKPLVHDHPFFGIGRGAFESVFPAYRLTPGHVIYTHAENFVVQWAAEWGLPVTCAALGAFGWAFAPRRLGVQRSALAAGGWCGVAALALQNLVDLGLEIPAVSIGAAAVLGSLWGDQRRRGAGEPSRGAAPAYPRMIGVGVAALGAVITAADGVGGGPAAGDAPRPRPDAAHGGGAACMAQRTRPHPGRRRGGPARQVRDDRACRDGERRLAAEAAAAEGVRARLAIREHVRRQPAAAAGKLPAGERRGFAAIAT
jgi:hypothetical protein